MSLHIIDPQSLLTKICPGLQVNEIHAPYDRHHEMSPGPNPHPLNASNSCLHDVIVSDMKSVSSEVFLNF